MRSNTRLPLLTLFLLPGLFFGKLLLADAKEQLQPAIETLKNAGFNDPAGATFNWSMRSAGLGSFKVIQGETPETPNILQIAVKQTAAKPWSMELLQPLGSDVARGSTLYVKFDYKISKDYCFHFYWQVEAAPWPKLLSLRITEPVDAWQTLRVAVPVHEDYFADKTSFSFHLAEKTGLLELRNLSAKLYPPGVDPERLETNVSPVLGGDFYDNDWRGLVLEKIHRNRQGTLQITVKQNEQPVPDASISLRQKSSSFQIGVEASAALLVPEILSRRELADLAKRIKPYKELLPEYKKNTLSNPFFSFISFYDGFLWRDHESWGREIDQKLLEQTAAAGKEIRGHALFAPAFMFAPPKCRSQNRDKLWETLMKHVESLSKRHAGKISAWEVLHGAIEYNEIYNFIGVDSIPEVFRIVRKTIPATRLLISDLNSLGEISDIPLTDLIELLDWLKTEEIAVDGLVLGVNLKRLDVAPQSMEKRLDRLAAKVGVPIHIRNLAINDENPEVQADMIRDYLLLFFSRREIASISLGELWEAALLNPNMAFLDKQMQPKKALQAVRKLILEDWVSNLELKSDANGEAEVSPFLGKYDLEVHSGQLSWKQEIQISNPDTALRVLIDLTPKQ
ncbi:MAG: endo-1,4-beta-xylanase [Lentisphaeria bacterium]